MKCFGLDIGYGDTKAFDGVNIISFPTAVSMVVDQDGFDPKTCIIIDNEKFYAGSDVKGESLWFDPRTADFVGSTRWAAVLAKALKDSCFNTFRNSIVLGIPAAQYSRTKASNIVHQLKQKYISFGNEDRIDLINSNISIVPQGLGIYIKYVTDTKIDYKRLRIAVADMGYHTIDLVTMYQGKYLNDHAKSYPLGISKLLDAIAKEFCCKYGFFINRKRALDFATNRRVEWLGELYEVDNIDDIIKKYAHEVADIINNYMESQDLDIGIAGGGGTYTLVNFLKLKKKLVLVKSPESANAVGYWHYGMLNQEG